MSATFGKLRAAIAQTERAERRRNRIREKLLALQQLPAVRRYFALSAALERSSTDAKLAEEKVCFAARALAPPSDPSKGDR